MIALFDVLALSVHTLFSDVSFLSDSLGIVAFAFIFYIVITFVSRR